jgi:hypothetical protein
MSQSAPPAEEPSMFTLEERLAVVNLYEELGSYRAVAAVVGCDHKTVGGQKSEPRTREVHRSAILPR